jgi:hypothetical protein
MLLIANFWSQDLTYGSHEAIRRMIRLPLDEMCRRVSWHGTEVLTVIMTGRVNQHSFVPRGDQMSFDLEADSLGKGLARNWASEIMWSESEELFK